MNYRAAIDSHVRGDFLEHTQEVLSQNLELDPVVEALGARSVSRLRGLNNLLVPPLIEEDGFAYIPPVHRMRDSVPYVALRHGEALKFDSDDLLPNHIQIRSARRTLENWSGADAQSILVAQSSLIAALAEKLPPKVSVSLPRKSVDGIVWHFGGLIRSTDLGLSGVPSAFYQSTRPVLGLKFSGSDMPSARLVHELMHVDWQFVHPIHAADKEAKLKELYRNELRAHHYSARYAVAVAQNSGKLKQLWDYPIIAQHSTIEDIRKKFADPERPFEPTPKLIAELGRAGIAWTP